LPHLRVPIFAAAMFVASESFAQTPPPPGQPQQSGQGQQQPGQWQQQPGQPQPQPGQWQQQPGQWQQQPGQWQQQPGQWQQQGRWQDQGYWAQQPTLPPPKHKSFESSFGFKLLAGANVWSSPDNIEPPGYDALGFAGSAGGFGWGAALYYEARIARYLGLELDFGYDHSSLRRNLDYKINNVPFKVNESVTASGIRWGLLVKAIAPVTFGRIWLGLGPELVSGSSVDGSVEVTDGTPTPTQRKGLEESISTTSKSSTMLTMAFGFAFEIGDHLEIPLDFRAAKNFSQDSDWKDRVETKDVLSDPPKYDVTVQSSWDFRLATGLAYRF
jgi:opacity protein-like surface antigen